MRLEVELITNKRCLQTGCAGCFRAEQVVREVAAELGVPVPVAKTGSGISLAAGVGEKATIALRHLGCDEVPRIVPGLDLPVIRINGEVVLSGPHWTSEELRAVLRRAASRKARR